MFTTCGMYMQLNNKYKERLVSILKQGVRATLFKFFDKIRRVHFIHTADIMYPHQWGETPIQLVIVSRYLDTLMWKNGEKPIWHIRLSQESEFVQQNKDKFTEQYIFFLNNIQNNGFNPFISQFFARQTPFWGVYDGTHRLGYLLSLSPNSFVPVKISHSLLRQPTHKDGRKWLLSFGLENEYIDQLVEAYNNLLYSMRRYLTAYFSHNEIFAEHRDVVIDEFNNISKIIKIEEGFIFKKTGRPVTVINFELPYQNLYFEHGKLKSRCIDNLNNNIKRILGGYGWEIASSVTESILLEMNISNVDANYQ